MEQLLQYLEWEPATLRRECCLTVPVPNMDSTARRAKMPYPSVKDMPR
jgi:hypothetical protein